MRRRFRDDIHGVLTRAHTRRGGAPVKPRESPTPGKTPSQEKAPEPAAKVPTPTPVPEPAPKAAPRVRKMVYEEATEEAQNLRQEVQDVRRKLARLDAETTKLTAQLKGSRTTFVSQVREQCKVEAKVASVLKGNAAKLPAQAVREEEELNQEVAKLSQELHEAKKEGAKWAGVAKRQEEMLQEESDAAKGAESLLARHPCGDVFLTPYPDDGSDDGGYYGDGGPRRHGRRDDVALGSSDEDDYEARRGRHERSVPQPPGQKWRSPLGHEDGDDSDGSSMPSPSGSSGPLSASASPSGEHENGRMAASLAKRAGASSSSGSRVGIAGGPRASSISDSEEEDSSVSAGASGSSDVRQSPSGTSGSASGGKFKKAVHKVTTQALKESRELSQQSGMAESVSEEISSEEKLSASASGGPGASGRTVSSSGDEV